jgi:hypothetical protein
MTTKYTVRRLSDTEYQLEKPDGTVWIGPVDASNVDALPTDPNKNPDIPADLAEPVVSYAESNNALHELRVLQWIGIRYKDDK